jgi:hypothetical protein
MPVLEILVNRAVKLVGSAAQHGVELAARGMAVFRAELVLQHGELRDGVIRNGEDGTGDVLAVVIYALDCEVIVTGPLATH